MIEIRFTKPQAEHVSWCLDAMTDYWGPDGDAWEDGTYTGSGEVPTLRGRVLHVSEPVDEKVVDDLLFRLEELCVDQARFEMQFSGRDELRAIRNASRKIRDATGCARRSEYNPAIEAAQ